MILVYGVLAGLLAALLRAWSQHRPLRPPPLHAIWLVVLAFLPQWLAFHNMTTGRHIPDGVASALLVLSQLLLLVFAWRNRKLSGMWALGLGVAMNLTAIVANGGFMPVSPEVATRLAPEAAHTWTVGDRLWLSKDIVLPAGEMALPWLADRFLLPAWVPVRSVFSLGDVVIALGAFGLLWSMADPQPADDPSIGEQVQVTT